tara:strand:+ start:474 stop:1103 length:630 start_codon:yes stop_codon:yes gene_type:complete
MLIQDKIIQNKDKIQSFLNNLNCDDEKWFMYNCERNENPVVRNYSNQLSYRIMKRNTWRFRSRMVYLKVMEDMYVSQYQYSGPQIIKFDQMALELDKYEKVDGGYLRTDILGDVSDIFADKRVYTIHYIEALGPVDPHTDPWRYDKNYRNVIFYDKIPDDVCLKILGEEVKVQSPQLTNFGNEIHTYEFEERPFPLKILHIDHEDEGIS